MNLANNLAWTIDWYAHNGVGVDQGTVDAGIITQDMLDNYNTALSNVKNYTFKDASEVLYDEHDLAIDQMHTAINDLVDATSELQKVVVVADMAADAKTTEDQQQFQQVLNSEDMSISQEEVDSYNTAITEVEQFANQAAGFLSAALDSNVTESLDNYAASNNTAVTAYNSVQYDFTANSIIFDYGNDNVFTASNIMVNIKTAAEIYEEVGYGG